MTRLIYSFVVDSAPKYRDQARIFLLSLLATGVAPEHIHAHLTPSAGENSDLTEALTGFGVRQHRLRPFLDGAYCNKLVQLDALPLNEVDCVALCDTDLAFLQNLGELARSDVVRAKTVDMPNPPLVYLEEAREICGLAGAPRILSTSCDDALTWSTNCNGGLYLLPAALAPSISAAWKRHATTLYAARAFLEGYAHHIDQIAFAMAMLDLGLDIDELPIEYNFPIHLADRFPPDADIFPLILHYHWLHNGSESVQPSGHASLDRAVAAVNARLRLAGAAALHIGRPL